MNPRRNVTEGQLLLTIRCTSALPEEILACLALLPEAQGLPVEWLIAREDGRLAGAAAVVWRSWADPGGLPVAVNVLPGHRRRGVGRALLEAAKALATGEAGGLWFMPMVSAGSPQAAFLEACGFQPKVRMHHFEGEIDMFLARVGGKVAARLSRPASGVRVESLAETNLESVAWLVSDALGDGPVATLHKLRGLVHGQRGDPLNRSLVATMDGAVAGVLLWRIENGVAMIDATVIAKPWRKHGLATVLMLRALEVCHANGVTRGRFSSEEAVVDALDLTARISRAETPVDLRFHFGFQAAAS
jgi:GNAT superfamily N-acetyltransferase